METCFNADEIQMISDRLENSVAMLAFLCSACGSLSEREQPLTSGELYGMMLAFQSLADDLESVQKFVRKAA